MREIKCRVWDKQTKTMTYFEFKKMCYKGIWDLLPNLKNFDPNCVTLFIRFKDSQGKEIYEDDILQNITHVHTDWYELVEWDDEYGGYSVFYEYDGQESKPEEFIVKGNIYENPELLKKLI